jgi:FkbM family methyltransferase
MKITNEGIAVIETDTRHISKWVEQHKRLDIQEGQIRRWLKNVPVGGVCVDVGAFIGDTALTMAKHVGPDGVVLAIDPNPEAYECLKYNMEHNEIMSLNTVTFNHAVGPVSGEPCTLMKDTNAGASWLSRHGSGGINTIPLDDTVRGILHEDEGKVSFIKIDVEGWEVEVLESAKEILARDKPDLLIEVNHGALERQGATMKDITDILTGYGYRWQITDPSIKPTDPQFDIFCTTK